MPNDDEWLQIELAYGARTETLDEIAERFGVSRDLIQRRRRAYGWPPRRQSANDCGKANAHREVQSEIAAGLHRLIKLKLERLEVEMSSSDERSAADHERDTRAIGTLIRGYEKIRGLDQEGADDVEREGPGWGPGSGPERTGAQETAEQESIRKDLAQQFIRLCGGLQSDSGGNRSRNSSDKQ